jgi:hypothetical protein
MSAAIPTVGGQKCGDATVVGRAADHYSRCGIVPHRQWHTD